MKTLDQNVTVVDPREAEAAFRHEFKGVRSMQDAERAAAESLERTLTPHPPGRHGRCRSTSKRATLRPRWGWRARRTTRANGSRSR